MANHKQAMKRARQTVVRTERNKSDRSTMRSAVKKAEVAIEGGKKEEIGTNFKAAMSALHKAVSKGLIKKNTAARKISRMSARIKSGAAK